MSSNNSGLVLNCTATYAIAAPVAGGGVGATIIAPVITMDKNRGRTLVQTPPLSAMLITSNTRPRFSPQPIGFEGGSIIRMFATSTVLNGAAVSNIQFSVAISIV